MSVSSKSALRTQESLLNHSLQGCENELSFANFARLIVQLEDRLVKFMVTLVALILLVDLLDGNLVQSFFEDFDVVQDVFSKPPIHEPVELFLRFLFSNRSSRKLADNTRL